MKVLPLSELHSSDLDGIFTEERREWASELGWDYRDSQGIISAMIDAVELRGFAAINHGRPVGYCFYLEQGEIGFIGGCFVVREYDKEGVKEDLLMPVVRALKTNRSITRIEAQFMNFGLCPVAQFFQCQSFMQFERAFMRRNCEPPLIRQIPIVNLKLWRLADLNAAAFLTEQAYRLSVDSEVTCNYRTVQNCREFLKGLILRPGCGTFIPEGSYCAWDAKSSQLVGYVLTSRISAQNGHIPQIVVSSEYQGKGIGWGLLGRAVRYLGLNGYQTTSLTVTTGNTAAMSLYARFGFRFEFPFSAFVWQKL